ncbi:heme/hemin ABC transporter substrate-binding protein [Rhodopila sp.]|uniref:heme/hemin ABC transporter substrate-binding protein n=1 Tax=Rhodopila sp. TaxID=2480087 RepID=UPI002D8089A6|nr:ABC transporter substrate-binding protein [Rhodopila sp.]
MTDFHPSPGRLPRRGLLALPTLALPTLALPTLALPTLLLPALVSPGVLAAAPVALPLSEAQTTRLVTIGGAVTETVYALGQGHRIVAVDTTSLYPPEALREKKSVGYMRALSAEGVLSVDPTAILLIDGAGPPAVVEQLRRSAVPVVPVDGTPTPEAVSERARFLGRALNVAPRGEALALRIEAGFATLATARAKEKRRPRVMFVLSLRGGRPLAAGRDTAADAMIALAGGDNVLADFKGYKALTDEAVIQAAPEIVLMMDGGEGTATRDSVLAMPAFQATPAGRAKAVVSLDGETLLGFGPRTPETALSLAQRFAALVR